MSKLDLLPKSTIPKAAQNKNSLLAPILLLTTFIILMLPQASFAPAVSCHCYCGIDLRAPCGDADCKRACGWKEPSSGSSGGSSTPSYDDEAERQRQETERQRQLEAERQRQLELQEQMKKEEEEAKIRQEQFERNKDEALKSMKGITEGELGLKGTNAGGLGLKDIGDTGTGSLGLKDAPAAASTKPAKVKKPNCEWGTMDSSVVDLRCLGLDPNKPISVDPHVIRGKERAFPVQPDPKTFENINYNKGFEALMRFDVASAAAAVEYFQQAQKERPNDPLVRNGLLLAQDILKARQKKEANDKARAADLTRKTYASLMVDEIGSARSYITRARELDPNNNAIRFLDSTLAIIGPESVTSATPEQRAAYKLVGHGLISMAKEDYAGASRILEVSHKMAPDDPFIAKLLTVVSNYNAGSSSAKTGK